MIKIVFENDYELEIDSFTIESKDFKGKPELDLSLTFKNASVVEINKRIRANFKNGETIKLMKGDILTETLEGMKLQRIVKSMNINIDNDVVAYFSDNVITGEM